MTPKVTVSHWAVPLTRRAYSEYYIRVSISYCSELKIHQTGGFTVEYDRYISNLCSSTISLHLPSLPTYYRDDLSITRDHWGL